MFKDWKQFKKAWVKALRSGDYVQGQRRLVKECAGVDQFCCLGVAGNLLIKAGHPFEWSETAIGWYFGTKRKNDEALLSIATTPRWLRNRLYEEGTENRLTTMNDSGRSFDYIADFIENVL